MKASQTTRSCLLVALGVAFEHFDMMLVSLLASAIVGEFVGSMSPLLTLLYAYVGYAIAFLFRPLGAFCFGCVGDLYGRKAALVSSMVLMSTATLALAFIPSAEALGIASTLIFLLCRICQGLAVGGEYGTAMTYAFELSTGWRTFYGACVVASTHVGGLAASFLASLYIENVRMIFFIGGLAGFFILAFRSFIQEHEMRPLKKVSEIAKESVKDKKAILEAMVAASMLVFVFYGSLIYLNELVHTELGIPRSQIFAANAFLLSLWVVLPPCFGYVIDRYAFSYRHIMRFGATGVFLSAPLLGFGLLMASYPAILAAQLIVHLFHMFFCLCTPRFFGDLFANMARNTAISTTYSLSASFTAALCPMICHMNVVLFDTNFAICLPFMLIALATVVILKKERVYVPG